MGTKQDHSVVFVHPSSGLLGLLLKKKKEKEKLVLFGNFLLTRGAHSQVKCEPRGHYVPGKLLGVKKVYSCKPFASNASIKSPFNVISSWWVMFLLHKFNYINTHTHTQDTRQTSKQQCFVPSFEINIGY